PDRTIRGSEEITYTNNSPDTLRALLFKLLVNIHKPGAARLQDASPDYLTPGVQVDSFLVNGLPHPWNKDPNLGVNAPVRLQKPLAAHDSIQLRISWHYNVSVESGREGMI